jgi:uncharacterized protein (TIGR01777 family)
MSAKRVILPGGSGFLGRILAPYLVHAGYEVVILTRSPGVGISGVRTVGWDGETLGAWAAELEGAAAVINLAGRSVNCRYNTQNSRLIMDSRVNSTRVLGQAIRRCKSPPAIWLNSSTATIYKHSFDRAMDEASGEIGATPEAKDQFSVEVATAWEHTLNEAQVPGTRKATLRTAMVLSNSGSVFPVLRRLVRFGLGGNMGSGEQYVSWIHELDFCRAVEWIMARDDLAGPVNVAAPKPLPNREMMQTLRRIMGVPLGLPAAPWMLEIGAFLLRTETELIIKSRRVVPGQLLASGFQFQFPEFRRAVEDLIA